MPIVLGRYELGPLLGSGGFASVYRANDRALARDVAVKVWPPALFAAEATVEVDASFERFRAETLALSRLRSRHVARIFDFGRDAEVGLFLVMELVDGVSLDAAAIGRALLPHEVLRVARGVLDALAEAHAAGIVHRDIKPSNVLIPRGRRALDDVRVLDFGSARFTRMPASEEITASEGDAVPGTPAYMAPEQLANKEVGPSADVYAAGLLLFDVLGIGQLFPGTTLRDQLVARVGGDPSVTGRVPPPLGLLLERMLARDPAARFPDAGAALAAIGDLETAPVALGSLFESARPEPSSQREGEERPSAKMRRTGSSPSIRPPPGLVFGVKRLCKLAEDPLVALRDALHALDLAMIDALARRERGVDVGRIARAVALALRLELDAASLILEPLAPGSALARAFGATLIASRARKVTRARVEHDRTDVWVDEIDAELAAMLTALAVAMTTREDAPRNEARCGRAADRQTDPTSPAAVTAKMGRVAAACIGGAMPTSAGLIELLRLRDTDTQPPTPFHAVVRAMLLGVAGFRGDEHLARQQVERAAKIALESGNTLLETRATVAWGGMLVEIPSRVDQGLFILERATTLLAHGAAPSLEHVAEHNRGAALVIQGRYAEAAAHLHRARAAAKNELSLEHEIISCTNEALALTCDGEYEAATLAIAELSDKRVNGVSARSSALAYLTRSLYAMVFKNMDTASLELRHGMARAAEAEADAGDLTLLGELLGILYASARGESVDLMPRAAELEKLAKEHGFASFYWMENLRSAVGQVREESLRGTLEETLSRLMVILAPVNDRARS